MYRGRASAFFATLASIFIIVGACSLASAQTTSSQSPTGGDEADKQCPATGGSVVYFENLTNNSTIRVGTAKYFNAWGKPCQDTEQKAIAASGICVLKLGKPACRATKCDGDACKLPDTSVTTSGAPAVPKTDAEIEKMINSQIHPDTTLLSGEDVTKQIQNQNITDAFTKGTAPISNLSPSGSGVNNYFNQLEDFSKQGLGPTGFQSGQSVVDNYFSIPSNTDVANLSPSSGSEPSSFGDEFGGSDYSGSAANTGFGGSGANKSLTMDTAASEAPSPCSWGGFSMSGCWNKVTDYFGDSVVTPANAGEPNLGKTDQTFDVTAYYPCQNASACPVQGGLASARPGLDGESMVRTLDDYRLGKSDYVTGASDPSRYGQTFEVPQVTYKSALDGKTYTLDNVPVYVHDTGSAFSDRPDKLDIAAGVANSESQAQQFAREQPFLSDRYQTYSGVDPTTRGQVPLPQSNPLDHVADLPTGSWSPQWDAGGDFGGPTGGLSGGTPGQSVFASANDAQPLDRTDASPDIPMAEWIPGSQQSGEDITAQIQRSNETDLNNLAIEYPSNDAVRYDTVKNDIIASAQQDYENAGGDISLGGTPLTPQESQAIQDQQIAAQIPTPDISQQSGEDITNQIQAANASDQAKAQTEEQASQPSWWQGAKQSVSDWWNGTPAPASAPEQPSADQNLALEYPSGDSLNQDLAQSPLDQKATNYRGTYQMGDATVKSDADGVTFTDSNGAETYVPRSDLGNQTIGDVIARAQTDTTQLPLTDAEIAARIPVPDTTQLSGEEITKQIQQTNSADQDRVISDAVPVPVPVPTNPQNAIENQNTIDALSKKGDTLGSQIAELQKNISNSSSIEEQQALQTQLDSLKSEKQTTDIELGNFKNSQPIVDKITNGQIAQLDSRIQSVQKSIDAIDNGGGNPTYVDTNTDQLVQSSDRETLQAQLTALQSQRDAKVADLDQYHSTGVLNPDMSTAVHEHSQPEGAVSSAMGSIGSAFHSAANSDAFKISDQEYTDSANNEAAQQSIAGRTVGKGVLNWVGDQFDAARTVSNSFGISHSAPDVTDQCLIDPGGCTDKRVIAGIQTAGNVLAVGSIATAPLRAGTAAMQEAGTLIGFGTEEGGNVVGDIAAGRAANQIGSGAGRSVGTDITTVSNETPSASPGLRQGLLDLPDAPPTSADTGGLSSDVGIANKSVLNADRILNDLPNPEVVDNESIMASIQRSNQADADAFAAANREPVGSSDVNPSAGESPNGARSSQELADSASTYDAANPLRSSLNELPPEGFYNGRLHLNITKSIDSAADIAPAVEESAGSEIGSQVPSSITSDAESASNAANESSFSQQFSQPITDFWNGAKNYFGDFFGSSEAPTLSNVGSELEPSLSGGAVRPIEANTAPPVSIGEAQQIGSPVSNPSVSSIGDRGSFPNSIEPVSNPIASARPIGSNPVVEAPPVQPARSLSDQLSEIENKFTPSTNPANSATAPEVQPQTVRPSETGQVQPKGFIQNLLDRFSGKSEAPVPATADTPSAIQGAADELAHIANTSEETTFPSGIDTAQASADSASARAVDTVQGYEYPSVDAAAAKPTIRIADAPPEDAVEVAIKNPFGSTKVVTSDVGPLQSAYDEANDLIRVQVSKADAQALEAMKSGGPAPDITAYPVRNPTYAAQVNAGTGAPINEIVQSRGGFFSRSWQSVKEYFGGSQPEVAELAPQAERTPVFSPDNPAAGAIEDGASVPKPAPSESAGSTRMNPDNPSPSATIGDVNPLPSRINPSASAAISKSNAAGANSGAVAKSVGGALAWAGQKCASWMKTCAVVGVAGVGLGVSYLDHLGAIPHGVSFGDPKHPVGPGNSPIDTEHVPANGPQPLTINGVRTAVGLPPAHPAAAPVVPHGAVPVAHPTYVATPAGQRGFFGRIAGFGGGALGSMGQVLGQAIGALFGRGSSQSTGSQSTQPIQNPIVPSSQTATPQKSVVTLIANPSKVSVGGETTLIWAAVGPTTCSITDVAGTEVGKGGQNSDPKNPLTIALSTTTIFTISCTGGTGSATSSATVIVHQI